MGRLVLKSLHRLLCGDATNADHVRRLMAGERANLFQTDPPYAVDYDGCNHPQSKSNRPEVRNRDWSETYNETTLGREFYVGFCRMAIEHAITQDAAWYCWHASKRQVMLESVWEEVGAFHHQQIIWRKSRPVLTYSAYMWAHEPCLMGWLKGNQPRMRKDYATGEWPRSVWDIPNSEIESDAHPTCKPVRLFTIPIGMHTVPGDLCYEPFSGSGSQLIAGEMNGRRVYGLELSPVFCDVIVARYEAFTGTKAVRWAS